MVTNFYVQHKKPIAICIVDNRKIYTSGWATEISNNLTDFLIYEFKLFNFDIYISDSEDELLATVKDEYSHAVLIASGTALSLEYHKLAEAIDDMCNKQFFIAGHVLDRNENAYWKNGYYELHHQFYIVNLIEYKEIGEPFVGMQEHIPHSQIKPIRSDKLMHDDEEVAEWISQGTLLTEYEMKCHGWNIISQGLLHNKVIIDLGDNIRNSKAYLYYEHEFSFMNQLPKVYHDQLFAHNFVISLNSDELSNHIEFKGPIDQYISVGTGVHWIYYLNYLGVTPDTKVIFADINYNCLQFMKKMITEWDGTNYAEFYKNNMPLIPNGIYHNVDDYIAHTNEYWEQFVSNFPNWLDMWNAVRSLNFDYVLINYMASYDLDWITPNLNTIVNVSDVFTHGPFVATQSLKYRVSCENRLIYSLQQLDPNIYIRLTSRSADMFYPTEQVMFDQVKHVELTDINLLQKPPWHETDWSSPFTLGVPF